MLTAEFKPTTLASQRPQTHALDRRELEPACCWLVGDIRHSGRFTR